jgi:hypothetical protein
MVAAQTEALQRYRGKGQQKVTVENVHVHTGGPLLQRPLTWYPSRTATEILQ